MKKMIAVVFVVTMSGCASDAQLRQEIAMGNLKIATEKAQRKPEPLVSISTPVPGGMLNIVVNNPMLDPTPQVAMPDNPTARVWEKAIDQTGTLLNIAAGGQAAKMLIKATSQGINTALANQPDPQPPVVVEQQKVEVVRPEVVERETVQVVNPAIVETSAAQVVNHVVIQPQPAQIVQPQVVQVPTQVIYQPIP